MTRWLAPLMVAALLLGAPGANAQGLLLGVGGAHRAAVSGGGGGYTGPGDVNPGAAEYYALRVYTASQAGDGVTKLIQLRRDSDNVTCDFFSAAVTGGMGTTGAACPAGSGLSPTAFAAGATLYVPIWYDTSGNGRNASNATTASQPIYNPACLSGGTLPCVQFSGAQFLQNGSPTITQAFTVLAVTQRTGGIGGGNIVGGGGAGSTAFGASGVVSMFLGGTTLNVSATEGAWHSLAFIADGASSAISVDGTPTNAATSPGSNSFGAYYLGANRSTLGFLTGNIAEVARYAGHLTTAAGGQTSTACHNDSSYYGTPSC